MSERAQSQWFGAKGVIRLAKDRLLATSLRTAMPTPGVDSQGGMGYIPGGSGVADQMPIIYKDSTDTYASKDLLADDDPLVDLFMLGGM